VKFELKGIATVRAKGKTYHYAWRGGPRLRGLPGTPEFVASYNEAVEAHRSPDKKCFRFVVVNYKASGDYKKLADSTRYRWGKWLDQISDHFGDLRIAQFDRLDQIRPIIRNWRNKWQGKPRAADYGMQVLSRVIAHAVDAGLVARNPCEGIRRLYENDRSEIIWTDADVTHIQRNCSAEISNAIDLARYTGLRLSDLLRLAWSHVGVDAIIISTGKSRHRREAMIPLYSELRDLLARIPKHSTTVLTSSRRRPWTSNGFGSSFNTAKIDAGLSDRDLNFNDLRGTAATKFYIAGFTMREIAETLAWEEESVEKIIRRYVGRGAAINARIEKMEAKRRTEPAKPPAKLSR
jgi:integrase